MRENVRAVISMKEHCDSGVWYRVGYLSMSNPSQHCPTIWRENSISGMRACGRSTDNSILSAFYHTGQKYAKVCGRVIGYQLSSPDTFAINPPCSSVYDVYVNGVSVTHGANPRRHIWTFSAGVTEGSMNVYHPLADCPCVHSRVYSSPIEMITSASQVIHMRYGVVVCYTVMTPCGMERIVKACVAVVDSLLLGLVWHCQVV